MGSIRAVPKQKIEKKMKHFLLVLSTISLVSASKSPKKGIIIPSWPRHFCFDFDAFDTVSWWYNYYTYEDVGDVSPWWCTYSNGTRPKGEDRQDCFSSDPQISFVPMIFGIPGHGIHGNDTQPDPDHKYKEILGFNEPDQEGHQSDIPPGEAALAWIEMQEKYPDQALVAPGVSSMTNGWFDEFMEACNALGCRIDYLACHSYVLAPKAQIKKLQEFSER